MHPQSREVRGAEYWTAEGWHSSQLKDGCKLTARAYYARHLDPDREPFRPSDAMRQGSLADCLITEPGLFDQLYIVRPGDLPKRPTALQLQTGEDSRPGTKARAAWEDAQARESEWLAWEEEAKGREVVPRAWVENAEKVREVLLADPEIGPRLRDALPSSQVGWQWHDPDLGPCLYKPDLETQAGGLWDLKKSRSAHPRLFASAAYDYGYDLQLAHYSKGYGSRHWGPPTETGIIAYEFDPPFDYCLLTASPELLAHGAERRLRGFQRISELLQAEVFPSHEPQTLELPAWVKGQGPEPEPMSIDEIELF